VGLTRDAAIDYANERGIPIPVKSKASPYSIDENAWGRTAECGILEDPWAAPPEDVFERTVSVQGRARRARGGRHRLPRRACPSASTVGELPLAELVAEIDRRAGAHGVGRIDMIEDRLVGIKSREIYECPGAITLITAHRDLEDLCLEQELAEHKRTEEGRYAQLIYNGLWWGPLKKAIDAFIDEANRYVNGEVRVQLFKGQATVVGRRSPTPGSTPTRWRPTTRATSSTRPSPRASSSCGVCRSRPGRPQGLILRTVSSSPRTTTRLWRQDLHVATW
jgi:argininosuccinate synthase